MQQQSRKLNIVKAICIFLMVSGHSGLPAALEGFIYLFHMPAFFFLSGFLLKESWFDNPLGFIKKRLGSLYAPFVFWELVFLLLTGVSHRLYLIDYQLSAREMLQAAAKYVTFRGHQPLLNGFWFLKTLFFCSIACLFLLKYVRRGRGWLVAAMVVAAALCRIVPYETTMFSRLFMACAFYISGFLAAQGKFRISLPVATASFAAVALISLFWRQSILADGWEALLYYPVAMLGTVAVFGFAESLDRDTRYATLLDSIGRATLTILTFHFLSFKLVSLLKIALWHLPIGSLAEFPVIHAHNTLFWFIYALVGTLLPLGIYTLRTRSPKPQGVIKLF